VVAIRPQRITPSDSALVSSQQFAAIAQVKQNAAGLNLGTVPIVLGVGNSVTSPVIDISGYVRGAIYVSNSAGPNACHLNVHIVDPTDGSTVLTQINTGQLTGAATVITPLLFGTNIAVTNMPFYLIKVQLVGDIAGNLTFISSLLLSNP